MHPNTTTAGRSEGFKRGGTAGCGPPWVVRSVAFDCGVFDDDFDVDAESGAVFDECVLEARVDPGLGQGRVCVCCLVEEVGSDGVVADAGRGDDDGQE